MASTTKKVEKVRQIVRLKQVMKRWKAMSLRCRSELSVPELDSNSGSSRHIPAGFLAVYVGPERKRFVILTRFLNLPVFISLLQKAEEEFGYQSHGGLVLPCEVGFFKELLKALEKDEQSFKKLELDEFLKMFSEVGLDSCKQRNNSSSGFTPLLQKARV